MEVTHIINENAQKFAHIPFAAQAVAGVGAKLKEMGMSLIADNIKDPAYVPKHRLDEVIAQREQLKAQAGDLTDQLETMKKSAAGNADLRKHIEDLQSKMADGDATLKRIAVESAVKLAAAHAKAKDPSDMLKFIDTKKLKVSEDGSVEGLAEQIDALRKEKPYLFEPEASARAGSDFSGNPPTDIDARIAEAVRTGDVSRSIALKNQKFKLTKGN